jgi:hypothetical protein
MGWLLTLIGVKGGPGETGVNMARLLLVCVGILGVPLVIMAVFLGSAGRSPHTGKTTGDRTPDNPLDAARQELTRETQLDSCRSALAQLNTFLSKNESRRPKPMTAAERTALTDRLGLDEGEPAEVAADAFTPLDGHHLELCFLLRDAAASLDVDSRGADGRPPAPWRRAAAAFDWVVREVRLEKSDAPTLPPLMALRRGWGTPLERALIFIELLRHIGPADEKLTGCLLFCPGKDVDRRFWACGVLVGDKPDLYLFDPRLGLPVPGPKGEGVATLADAGGDPAVLGQLTVDKAHPYDVTADQAAKAQWRYVCPLSALAPRMRLLQDDLLPPTVKVRVFVDAEDDLKRLTAAAKVGPKSDVQPWQDEGKSGAGVLRRFLPPDEGGVDASKPGLRFFYVYGSGDRLGGNRGIVPVREMHPFFRDQSQFPLESGLGARVWGAFAQPFLQLALFPHHPRDELLRGRYAKAVPELVETRTRCQDAQNRLSLEKNLGPEVKDWLERAFPLYAELQRAAGDPLKTEEATQKINMLWREARALTVLLEGTRAGPQRREVVYLLGLCKQEQAERLQAHAEGAAAEGATADAGLARRTTDAWKEAVNVWQQYLEEYGTNPFAGNAPGSAARMLGRARLMSGDREGAVETWRLELPTSDPEKVGNLYLAKKAEK